MKPCFFQNLAKVILMPFVKHDTSHKNAMVLGLNEVA